MYSQTLFSLFALASCVLAHPHGSVLSSPTSRSLVARALLTNPGSYVCPPNKNSFDKNLREEYSNRNTKACCEYKEEEIQATDCLPAPKPTRENPNPRCPPGTEVACCENLFWGLKQGAKSATGTLCIFPSRGIKKQKTLLPLIQNIPEDSHLYPYVHRQESEPSRSRMCHGRETRLYCPNSQPGSGGFGCVIDENLLSQGDPSKIHCCSSFTPNGPPQNGVTHGTASGCSPARKQDSKTRSKPLRVPQALPAAPQPEAAPLRIPAIPKDWGS